MFSWLPYFVPNRWVSLESDCWKVFISSPPTCWLNFLSLLWNVLFCQYCFTLYWYLLIFLLSQVLSDLFPQVVLLFFVLAFPFCLYVFQRLSIWVCYCRVFFLSVIAVEFLILILIIFSCFLGNSLFFLKLISPLHRLVIIIIIIITPLEIFTSALADGFSPEFEWQQVSSNFQDSSRYSSRLQKCCSLDSVHSPANLPVLQAL